MTVLTRRGDSWDEAVFRDEQISVSLVLRGLTTKVAELWIDTDDAEDDAAAEVPENGA
jgi:hypothetical protein